MSSFLSPMDIGPLKKAPLLPAPSSQPKAPNVPKNYIFELELGESNDQTYPEFSWAELVKDVNAKELAEKVKKGGTGGGTILDPYASDDEDDLKALAARLEEKYGGQAADKPSKKKKQKLNDCIDRGAGYDESDSFIDNTDAYDERVPKELQPAYGGFYINSGQLNFKEVQVSEEEEEDDDSDTTHSTEKITKSTKSISSSTKDNAAKPACNSNLTPDLKLREQIRKNRKISQSTPVSRQKVTGQSEKPKPNNNNTVKTTVANDSSKKRTRQISSSSSSNSDTSSSTSSEDSSSSTDSNDNEDQEKKQRRGDPDIIILHSTTPAPPKTLVKDKHKNRIDGKPRPLINTKVSIKPTTLIPRKPRVKNVPLNPNLNRKDVPGSLPLPIQNSTPIPVTIGSRIINTRDFIKPKPGNLGPKLKNVPPKPSPSPTSSQSSSPIGHKISTPTSVIKVPTPKSSLNSQSISSTITTTATTPQTHPSPVISCSGSSTSVSPLSLSSELSQIFSADSPLLLSATTTSPNSTYRKSTPPPKTKTAGLNSISAEAMGKDVLRTTASASSGAGKQQNSAEIKPLPKLKHKSGFTIEKQKQSASPPPSSFNPKPLKVNLKHLIPTSSYPVSSSPHSATITSTSNAISSPFQPPAAYNPGTVEITKLKKTMPALGSNITVTEVREKTSSPVSGMATITSTMTGNLIFGGNNNGKGPSFFHNHNQSPVSISASSNLASVISSNSSTSTLNNHQKIAHSVSISPSPLTHLTSDLSDRFTVGNFLENKQNNKLPGFIRPYDVSALLSGSKPLPDIPACLGTKSTSDFGSTVNSTNRK